jgi:hypothetical protein
VCGAVAADPMTMCRDSSEGIRANDHILDAVFAKQVSIWLPEKLTHWLALFPVGILCWIEDQGGE